MMKNDAQLIRRILSGNDEAFSVLVQKHQKSIHALAWRKVGDFHIAEEIVVEHVLTSFSDSWLKCLPVFLDHRHDSLRLQERNLQLSGRPCFSGFYQKETK